jgi:LacI family transcriptional regulator
MRDVAALAHVSVKTVSRVINGEPGAGPEVAERVRVAARSLGYRPNLSASSLRRSDRRSATIGVVLEDLSNPFDSALLRAVEERARERGVLVLAASDEDDAEQQAELLDALAVRRIDGLVTMPSGTHQDRLHAERERGLPMVLVDRPPTFSHTDSVTTDNRESTRAAVTRLAALGHRRIAYLGDRTELWTNQERTAGYVEGLASAGVPLDPALVRSGLRGSDVAAAAAGELLDLPNPPTAVFAAQNLVTVGVVRALRARSRHEEVALIGFDDFPLADLLEPAVSVVRQDLARLGRTAADRVFSRIDGDDSPARRIVIPAEYLARRSGEIAPPRG